MNNEEKSNERREHCNDGMIAKDVGVARIECVCQKCDGSGLNEKARIRSLTEKLSATHDALVCMVYQHCRQKPNGELRHDWLSANEDALMVLVEHFGWTETKLGAIPPEVNNTNKTD